MPELATSEEEIANSPPELRGMAETLSRNLAKVEIAVNGKSNAGDMSLLSRLKQASMISESAEQAIQAVFPDYTEERYANLREKAVRDVTQEIESAGADMEALNVMVDNRLVGLGMPSRSFVENSKLAFEHAQNRQIGLFNDKINRIRRGWVQPIYNRLSFVAPELGKSTTDDFNRNKAPVNPDYDDSIWSDLATGVGNVIGNALLLKGLGKFRTPATTTALFAVEEAGRRRADARAKGASFGTEFVSTLAGAGIGATEAITFGRFMNRFNRATGGVLERNFDKVAERFIGAVRAQKWSAASEILGGAVENAGQEVLQEGLTFAFDKSLGLADEHQKEQGFWDMMRNEGLRAGTTGGALGLLMNGVSVGARRSGLSATFTNQVTQDLIVRSAIQDLAKWSKANGVTFQESDIQRVAEGTPRDTTQDEIEGFKEKVGGLKPSEAFKEALFQLEKSNTGETTDPNSPEVQKAKFAFDKATSGINETVGKFLTQIAGTEGAKARDKAEVLMDKAQNLGFFTAQERFTPKLSAKEKLKATNVTPQNLVPAEPEQVSATPENQSSIQAKSARSVLEGLKPPNQSRASVIETDQTLTAIEKADNQFRDKVQSDIENGASGDQETLDFQSRSGIPATLSRSWFRFDRGAVGLGVRSVRAVARGIQSGFKGAMDITGFATKWETEPLEQSVKNQIGGGRNNPEFQKFVEVNKETRDRVGALTPLFNSLRPLVNGVTPKSHRVFNELSAITWSKDGLHGTSIFQLAVEGKMDISHLSKDAQKAVNLSREIIRSTGKLMESVGARITMENGDRVPFKASKHGDRLSRQFTDDGFGILMRAENDPLFKALAQAIADRNGKSITWAGDQISKMKDHLVTKKSPMEIARKIPDMPSVIQHDGKTYHILNQNPFTTMLHTIDNTAARSAYISVFGQSPDGSVETKLIQDFARKGGNPKDMDNLLRTLNRMPLEFPVWSSPGSPTYGAYRFWMGYRRMISTLHLSRSGPVNFPEPIGTTGPTGGLAQLGSAINVMSEHPKALAQELAHLAVHTQSMLNITGRPGRPVENFSKAFSELGTRVTGVVAANEFNEVFAAARALGIVNALHDGTAFKPFYRPRIEILDFTDAEVEALLSGKADTKLQVEFMRRFTEFAVGVTASLPQQRSRRAQSRIANAIHRFDSFFQVKMNRTQRIWKQLREDFKRVAKDPSKANAVRFVASSELMGEWIAGNVAAGGVGFGIRAMLLGGAGLLAFSLDEAEKDDRNKIAVASDMFLAAMLSGPADGIMRTVKASARGASKGVILSAMAGTVGGLPGDTFVELVDWSQGTGRYRDAVGFWQNANAWFTSNTPIIPTLEVMLVGEWGAEDQILQKMISKVRSGVNKQRKKDGRALIPAKLAIMEAARALRDGQDPYEIIMELMGPDAPPKGKLTREQATSYLDRQKVFSGLDDEEVAEWRGKFSDADLERADQWAEVIDKLKERIEQVIPR